MQERIADVMDRDWRQRQRQRWVRQNNGNVIIITIITLPLRKLQTPEHTLQLSVAATTLCNAFHYAILFDRNITVYKRTMVNNAFVQRQGFVFWRFVCIIRILSRGWPFVSRNVIFMIGIFACITRCIYNIHNVVYRAIDVEKNWENNK